ncbi:MAG: trehalose-phosphatase [Candidatus Omnitrophota bacterium]
MDYLLDRSADILKKVTARYLFVFLDFDGTLAPIAQTPSEAAIPEQAKQVIKELSELAHCKVAVISGRALEDIKSKVGLNNIIYAGNHGLELEGPKIKFKSPVTSRYKDMLGKIKDELQEKLSGIKGVFFEDKRVSFALHYRLAEPKDVLRIKSAFHETVIVYLAGNKITIKEGKMVFEVRPPVEWDKGKIIMWLLARQRFGWKREEIFPIYIGDDLTDEDAFKAIGRKGLTIFVGTAGRSCAQYYLRDVGEVSDFLKMILCDIKRGNSCPKH